jgi:hypothetical protein
MKNNKIPQAIRIVKRIQKFESLSIDYESKPVKDSYYEQYPCCSNTVVAGHSHDCYFHEIINSMRSYENLLFKAIFNTPLSIKAYKNYFNSQMKDTNLISHLYGYIIKHIHTKQIDFTLLEWINLYEIIKLENNLLQGLLLGQIESKIKKYSPAKAIIEHISKN